MGNDIVAETLEERGKMYGDAENCHRAIGQVWAGILTQNTQRPVEDIPPHVVALMMVAFKCVRASGPAGPSIDTFVDIHGYATLAEQMVGDLHHSDHHAEEEPQEGPGDMACPRCGATMGPFIEGETWRWYCGQCRSVHVQEDEKSENILQCHTCRHPLRVSIEGTVHDCEKCGTAYYPAKKWSPLSK